MGSTSKAFSSANSSMNGHADKLVALANHLSSSRPPKSNHPADLSDRIASFHSPGLSLTHVSTEDHHHFSDRKQAEEYALKMLSRPLEVSFTEAPEALLQNIYGSFAVLVDCRLRAYTSFLARHVLALASDPEENEDHSRAAVRAVEEKIAAILAIGKQVDAKTLYTRFEVQPKAKTSLEQSTCLLCFVAAMDLTIPVSSKQSETTSTSFSTTGSVQGTFKGPSIDAVKIDLDIKSLLRNMVDQASKVVSTIIDIASSACGHHAKDQISRSASCLSMPPPKARSMIGSEISALGSHRNCDGLELLSQAAEKINVVSPALGAGYFTNIVRVPSFDLEDVSNLSADQCADIVDTCLLDEDLEDLEPSRKKP